TEVIKQRKITETKIMTSGPVKLNEVHQVGKLPTIPTHLKTPDTIKLPVAPTIPAHIEKVVPKYEAPKPKKAGTKPLHGSLAPRPSLRQIGVDNLPTDPVVMVRIAARLT